MKTIVKLICASSFALMLAFSCAKVAEEQITFSSDPTALIDVPCKDPADQVLNLTTNANWIVVTPQWVKADPVFGSGNAIVSFKVESTYINDKTDVAPRSGEIVFSGGGKSYVVPISQLGYTVPFDPSAGIGGIPDVDEFLKFVQAVNENEGMARWMNASKEVELLADINLSECETWTPIGNPESVANGNYAGAYTGVAFKGVFNGGGHTIRGFKPTVKVADNQTFGLFGVLDGATVKNLNIETDLVISADAQADAGVLVGTAISSTIQNVKVSGKITSAGNGTDNKRFALGGIAGFVFNTGDGTSLIKDCTTSLTVNADCGSNTKNGATAAMYGGVAGFVTTSQDNSANNIENCVNNGEIIAKLGRCSGIVATANFGGHFKDCTNNANQVNSFANGRIGNVVSVLYKNTVAEGLVNNGNLTTSDAATHAGAIVGFFNDDGIVMRGGKNTGTVIAAISNYKGLIGANVSKFTSISGVTVGGKLGTYKADGNHEMIDVNAGNFEQYIGVVSDANRAKISDLTWDGAPAPVVGIGTAADLKEFASLVNTGGDVSKFMVDGAIVLGADIDLSEYGEWTPIGQPETVTNGNYAGAYTGAAFKGVFNGGGHTIRGFKPTVKVAENQTFGLFGVLDGATVKDLNIETDLVISADAQADAGVLVGTAISSTIQNVKVSGKLTSAGNATDNKRFALGGLAGFVFNTAPGTSLIKDCTINLVVNASNGSNTKNGASAAMYGGIAGFVTSSQDNDSANDIQNCVNNGEITAALARCSGIVATANYGGHFKDCTNNANQVNTFANGRIGNVVSVLYKNAVAEGLVNNGNLTTSDAATHAGAIVGFFNDGAIVMTGGKNTGTVIAANTTQRGLIGGNISSFKSISGVTVGGKIGTYNADGNHEMIDVNASNFEQYIGAVSDANRAKITDLTWSAN